MAKKSKDDASDPSEEVRNLRKLPKGAYRLPGGGYMRLPKPYDPAKEPVTKGRHRIVVEPVWRDEPDLERLAKVLMDLAAAQLEREKREAEEKQQRDQAKKRKKAA